MYDTIGPDIVRWRLEVLSEIGALVDDLVPDWADTLPSHVTDAYSGNWVHARSRLRSSESCWTPSASPCASVLEHADIRLPGHRANAARHRMALARVSQATRAVRAKRLPHGKHRLHSHNREFPATR